MPAAQHAAIGARLCTITAIRRNGRNFRTRRRINEPPSTTLPTNHAESPESRSGSRRFGATRRHRLRKQDSSGGNDEITAWRRVLLRDNFFQNLQGPTPYPDVNPLREMQPGVVKF